MSVHDLPVPEQILDPGDSKIPPEVSLGLDARETLIVEAAHSNIDQGREVVSGPVGCEIGQVRTAALAEHPRNVGG